MASDPINVLAQLALWRLELDVIAKAFGALFIGAGVGAAAIWGQAGADAVIWAILGLGALGVAWLVIRALTAPFRAHKDPTAECRHRAAQWAATRR